MSVKYAVEDPLVFRERYGVIHNAGVKVGLPFNVGISNPNNGKCSGGLGNDHLLESHQFQ